MKCFTRWADQTLDLISKWQREVQINWAFIGGGTYGCIVFIGCNLDSGEVAYR